MQAPMSYEVERGKPLPSKNHAFAQCFLLGALSRYKDEYTVFSELSLELDGVPLVPDISVYPKMPIDWRHDELQLTMPPALVIEILSANQPVDDLVKRANHYFAAGVRSCWIVQPSSRTIAVLSPGKKPERYSSGVVADPETGIEVAVDEVFP
ncbi:MAG: Uma2 family endonuclease [Rhodospirillales bacterium]|nr:Uma2 family endonuclease [Rhodospirillales bacterium]